MSLVNLESVKQKSSQSPILGLCNKTTPILKLPHEMTIRLFSYLTPEEVLTGVRLTCKSWSSLSRDVPLWKVIALTTLHRFFEKDLTILSRALGEQAYLDLLCKEAASGSLNAQRALLKTLEDLERTIDSCRLFEPLANAGNPWAQYCLAVLYLNFGKKHQLLAIELLEEATKKDVDPAQFLLGKTLFHYYKTEHGQELIKSGELELLKERGRELVFALADKGYDQAQYFVAVQFDCDKSIKDHFLKKAKDARNIDALFYQNRFTSNEISTLSMEQLEHPRAAFEYGRAKGHFEHLAFPFALSAPGQIGLAYARSSKDALKKSELVMFELLVSANKIEELPWLYVQMYLSGDVLTRDENEAFKWFKKLIAIRKDQSYEWSFFDKKLLKNLMDAHPIFCEKIVNFYKAKANQGKGYYCFRLADLYQSGNHIEKNIPLALELYEKAAEKGDLDGIYRLCVLYGLELFGKKDFQKFTRLADQLFEISEKKIYDVLSILEKELNVKETAIEYLCLKVRTKHNDYFYYVREINKNIKKIQTGSLEACFDLGNFIRSSNRSYTPNIDYFTEEVSNELKAFKEQAKEEESQTLFNLGRLNPTCEKDLRNLKKSLDNRNQMLVELCDIFLSNNFIRADERKALEFYEKLLKEVTSNQKKIDMDLLFCNHKNLREKLEALRTQRVL